MNDANNPNDTATSSESERVDAAPVLHWGVSVALLSLACAAAAWVSAMGASWGKSSDDAGAMTFALIFLLAFDPFFMRRNYDFTPRGLAAVAGIGMAIAALSWVFRFNTIVFVWIGMTWVLIHVAKPNPRGKMIAHQIALEKATRTSWINTKTEQSERMLVVYDFLTLLLIGFLCMAAFSAVAADTPPAKSCDEHALMDQQDYDRATACVKTGADPNVRDKAGRGPLNRLLWYGRGLSVLDDKTLPFMEALVDAGADLNHRPPNQEASAFEALLEEGEHITARTLLRRMLLREKHPVNLDASVSMRRSPPHDERRLTPLLWAIKVGDVEIAALLLKRGADPNQTPSPGMGTPLHHALHYNQPEIIRLLHRHGADIRAVSPAPILEAINGDHVLTEPETLRVTLELGALAAIENQAGWLLRKLSGISGQAPLSEAQFLMLAPYLKVNFADPQSRFLEQLLENNFRSVSRFRGNLPALRVAFLHALSSGANPNGSRSHTKVGASLLQMLCKLDDADLTLAKALLERGADPNLADTDGDTPLHQIAIDRAPLERRLATLPPNSPDMRIPDNPTWADMDKLLDPVRDQPERVEAIKKQALRQELEKRIGRLNAYEQLLLSKGANPALKNRKGLTPRLAGSADHE